MRKKAPGIRYFIHKTPAVHGVREETRTFADVVRWKCTWKIEQFFVSNVLEVQIDVKNKLNLRAAVS